jgi:hypothetical protein
MAKKASRRLTDQERAERHRQDRERLQRAARELLSSDGWARWVRVRAMFHSYSLVILSAGCRRCMLLRRLSSATCRRSPVSSRDTGPRCSEA